MSLLNFLRVLEGLQPWGGNDSPPPRKRRLKLETLEGRSVLTLLGLPLPPPLPITVPGIEVPPVIAPEPPVTEPEPPITEPEPTITEPEPTTIPEPPPSDDGGSGSGTGGPMPGDPSADPPTDLAPTDGSSGSGTGDPPSDPPPGTGSSGSGTGSSGSGTGSSGSGTGSSGSGTGEPPVITAISAQRTSMWIWMTGTVDDPDGPEEGLTVCFTIGNSTSVSFTTTTGAGGTFGSMIYVLPPGIPIYAYVIDSMGNHSATVWCTS
jgi:hypothetical protein